MALSLTPLSRSRFHAVVEALEDELAELITTNAHWPIL